MTMTYVLIVLGIAVVSVAIGWSYKNFMSRQSRLQQNQRTIEILEDRYREFENSRKKFIANINHELRTPLTLIIEPIRQLLKRTDSPEIRETLEMVSSNADKMRTHIDELLDLSKIEHRKMDIDLRLGDLKKLINPIYNEFKKIARKKKLQFIYTIDNSIEECYFDAEKLRNILEQLLSNAFKFTSEGSVMFKIQRVNDELIMTIEDSGEGISKEELPQIFKSFYQTERVGQKINDGVGVGLTLVDEYVKIMGGNITVESTLGTGTRVVVSLPFYSINHGMESEALLPPVKNIIDDLHPVEHYENHGLPILLLVEDNVELRTFIKNSISHAYTVLEASNGEEGYDMAKHLIPDLIITDLMMPEKDGFELTIDLKHDEATSHIPIILLTAESDLESRLKGLMTGADAYLTKPFNTEELLIRIAKLIEVRRVIQDKFAEHDLHAEDFDGQLKIEAHPAESYSRLDKDFLERIIAKTESSFSDPEFNVESLSKQVLMSRSQLFRKTKALVGMSPNEFIRNFRLDRARLLLTNENISVMGVAFEVGFKDEKYFSSRFKERFGYTPSELIKNGSL